jgi:hypothetical protein
MLGNLYIVDSVVVWHVLSDVLELSNLPHWSYLSYGSSEILDRVLLSGMAIDVVF